MKLNIMEYVNFNQVWDAFKDTQLPYNTTRKLVRIKEQAENESAFYYEQLKELIESYGEREENGDFKRDSQGNIKIQTDSIDKANAKLEELGAMEIELKAEPFSQEDLSSMKMTPSLYEIVLKFAEN